VKTKRQFFKHTKPLVKGSIFCNVPPMTASPVRQQELVEYLISGGYQAEKSCEVHLAYRKSGIEAAVDAVKEWDDEEHDYSSEMREQILKWQKSVRPLVTKLGEWTTLTRSSPYR